jgi:hypothetical protein
MVVQESKGPRSLIKTAEYVGLDRRRAKRRTGDERRAKMRYEPDKENRRSGKDRRKATAC